jgi:diguanylate cyclase (GGDEF)-like protein
VFREIVQSGIGLRTDFRFLLPDGSIRHMESRGGLIRNSRGQASRVVVVSRDITERKLAEEKIQNLAFHDVLTGLPNRRLLNDRLIQTMAASKRSGHFAALMFIDLDNFKPLNDRHGHAAGDLLLEEVARRITGCVREVDTVSRFGGDEFVVLLSELDDDKAESVVESGIVAEKIRVAMAEPYVLTIRQQGKAEATVTHRCTSSIGVVMFINHEISADDILRRADFAMYQAKEGGRNAIRFFDSPSQMKSG